jgi:hypothetical protein
MEMVEKHELNYRTHHPVTTHMMFHHYMSSHFAVSAVNFLYKCRRLISLAVMYNGQCLGHMIYLLFIMKNKNMGIACMT